MVPMPTDCIDKMYTELGPKEGTVHHTALEKKAGFSYQTLLGESMYAYITCRCDIGYAVTTLSKFSSSPFLFHYKLLKTVAKYSKATSDWGIRFKRMHLLEIQDEDYAENQSKFVFHRVSKYYISTDPT